MIVFVTSGFVIKRDSSSRVVRGVVVTPKGASLKTPVDEIPRLVLFCAMPFDGIDVIPVTFFICVVVLSFFVGWNFKKGFDFVVVVFVVVVVMSVVESVWAKRGGPKLTKKQQATNPVICRLITNPPSSLYTCISHANFF